MADPVEFPFIFNPAACDTCQGACCRWGGYVWVTDDEIQAMAEMMLMDLDSFANEYVKAAYSRLSLQERLREGEHHCCLLDPSSNRCLVYEARPEQCRTFLYYIYLLSLFQFYF